MDFKKEPRGMAKTAHEESKKKRKAHKKERIKLMPVSSFVEENYRRLIKYARANGHPDL